jgi:hypothetical protein
LTEATDKTADAHGHAALDVTNARLLGNHGRRRGEPESDLGSNAGQGHRCEGLAGVIIAKRQQRCPYEHGDTGQYRWAPPDRVGDLAGQGNGKCVGEDIPENRHAGWVKPSTLVAMFEETVAKAVNSMAGRQAGTRRLGDMVTRTSTVTQSSRRIGGCHWRTSANSA